MITFEELGLREELLRAIQEMGYESPTPIQEKALTHLLSSDQDVIAMAQTGTGKTAAFSLPILHKIDEKSSKIQCVILCPTRELCLQICTDIEKYSKYIKGFNTVAVYGGASMDTQVRALKKGVQIVVGTPGRTLDLIKRGKIDLSEIKWVVLDEADEMLSMGFKEDLNYILSETSDEKQTLLFSATMPKEIGMIAKKHMNDPIEISVQRSQKTSADVDHIYYVASPRDRYDALKRLVDSHPHIYAIVFCRTRREANEVVEKLAKDGYDVDALHGDLSQAQRDNVMQRFRSKQLELLIATDVAARGLDVDVLSHVINFGLPQEMEVYIHRSGRTGRAGNKGVCISIVSSSEQRLMGQLERKIGKTILKENLPSGKEICQNQLISLIDRMQEVKIDEDQIAEFMPAIYEKLDSMSKEEIIKKFVSIEFNHFLEYYKNAPDLNTSSRDRNDRNDRDRNDRGDRDGRNSGMRTLFSRFFINIGEKEDIQPKDLLALINDELPGKSAEVGKIEILKSFSFFEVDTDLEDEVLLNLNGKEYRGQTISVEVAKRKERRSEFGGGDRNRDGGDKKRSNSGSYGGGNSSSSRSGGSSSSGYRGGNGGAGNSSGGAGWGGRNSSGTGGFGSNRSSSSGGGDSHRKGGFGSAGTGNSGGGDKPRVRRPRKD